MSDPVQAERTRLRAVIVARTDSAIRGDGDVLDHARQVYRAWRRLHFVDTGNWDLWYDDDDRTFLAGVESELDRFPIGDERALWASDALAELEPELEGMRRDWGPRLVGIFQHLRDDMTRGGQAGDLE